MAARNTMERRNMFQSLLFPSEQELTCFDAFADPGVRDISLCAYGKLRLPPDFFARTRSLEPSSVLIDRTG